ncbi:MAG: hypothetical protein MR519_04630 [Spirochaetaceae bacterium]|nr:hypothetical protein [Spirochaetaceae bacterium]
MKKNLIVILAFITLLVFGSCSDAVQPKEMSERMVEISFGFNGEADSITQVPLKSKAVATKSPDEPAVAKNWYAIQVYDGADVPYAYGFFDNIEDMKLLCIKDDTYSFTVDMIPEAEGQVYHFSLAQAGWADIGNAFYYSKTESIRFLGKGYLYMKSPVPNIFNRPAVDRFFGRLASYKAVKNGKVNIKLSRSAFFAKFVAKEFTAGELEIALDNAPTFYLHAEDGNVFEHFYSFDNLTSTAEEIGVSIIWVNKEGKRIPLVAQNVNFGRSTLTTLEFTVKETEFSNTFSITADEELINGGKIDLDSIDDLVDTEIETTP